MKAITLTILCGIMVFLGYLIGNNRAITVENQRDRLADYIHEYSDMQFEGTKRSLRDAVAKFEAQDNEAGDMGFVMESNQWYFAY